ncbi:MAG: ATP-grasp domain-containing protein [Alphaproteobacteria bacterium]|nr:ATP-grasp domain-containing protein [Alphaproteobacteria bacterium]
MKILVAEYAVATGLSGSYQIEGRAMLTVLAASFHRIGHQVVYPTVGPGIEAGQSTLIRNEDDFETFLRCTDADAGLVIAPDDMLPHFLELLEKNTTNLGCSPKTSLLCADKLACTLQLEEAGVPVVEVLECTSMTKGPYVLKPRFGCDSDDTKIVHSIPKDDGRIITKYYQGQPLSVSLVCSDDRILPLTINRQLIKIENDGFRYEGSHVPYHTKRKEDILEVAKRVAEELDLRGYVGIDLILADQTRVLDVNPRPTTSLVGISKVMREEIADLLLQAKFGSLPQEVNIEGECAFAKENLKHII